jgi:hypothetical protein
MGVTAFRLRSLWLGVVAPVALVGLGAPAQAQGIFCPSTANGSSGITLQSGFCTNGAGGNGNGPAIGAFSNAALASQALSDVTQGSSQQSTDTVVQAVSARRRIEEVQQQAPPPAPRERKLPPREPSRTSTKTEPSIYKAPIAPVPYEPRWGVWAEGFGEYDKLTGDGAAVAPIVGGIQQLGTMNLSFTTKATTGGFVAGADRTYRNLGAGGGTLIAGILTGYLWSNLSSSTISSPTTAAGGTGFGTLSGHLSGPSLGAYATYFLNGFSTDLTLKVDFLHLNETFTDSLSFGGAQTFTSAFAGSGSTNLINYGIVWNIQQKIFLSNAVWIEPTVGLKYYIADYDSDAAALGLADGHVLRLQGGARLGTQFLWNNVVVTPVLTGLVYDDVTVSGLAVTDAAFLGTAGGVASAATEGKVRGQGIGAIKFDYGNGLSSFVQADVRGGSDYFGYGGRAGVRFVW